MDRFGLFNRFILSCLKSNSNKVKKGEEEFLSILNNGYCQKEGVGIYFSYDTLIPDDFYNIPDL